MATSLLENLRAKEGRLFELSHFFPESLLLHYQSEPEAVLLTYYGQPLSQSDWEGLKTLVDAVYALAPEEELQEMWREAKEAKEKVDRAHAREWVNRPRPPKPGYVYVIKAEHGLFKIGHTENLNTRLSALSTASPYSLQLVCAFKTGDTKTLEAKLHKRYAPSRKRGEWFELTPEQVDWLRSFDGSEPTLEGGEQ